MTILSILEERARIAPDVAALYAPGRRALSYSALLTHVRRTAAALRRRGLALDPAKVSVTDGYRVHDLPDIDDHVAAIAIAGSGAPTIEYRKYSEALTK